MLDLDTRIATRGDRAVELTRSEFRLLVCLLNNAKAGKGGRRTDIREKIFG